MDTDTTSFITTTSKSKKEFVHKIGDIVFDFKNLYCKSSKINSIGIKTVSVLFNEESFNIEIPSMLSFGINKWVSDKTTTSSISLSFYNKENNKKILETYSFFKELDNWAIDTIVKNSWDWLGIKNISREDVEQKFYSTVKKSSSNYPDYLKFKLKNSSSGYSTTFFNNDKEIINYEDIEKIFTKGSLAKMLVNLVGFWIGEEGYGLSWKIQQVVIYPRKSLKHSSESKEECLIDD